MKTRLTALLLITAIVASNFSRFFIYAGFELNRNYIAQNLCVNKSRPWLHCNGHCYFIKKIREARENEKKQDRADQQSRYQEALPAIMPLSLQAFKQEKQQAIYPLAAVEAIVHRSYSILLPPKVV